MQLNTKKIYYSSTDLTVLLLKYILSTAVVLVLVLEIFLRYSRVVCTGFYHFSLNRTNINIKINKSPKHKFSNTSMYMHVLTHCSGGLHFEKGVLFQL